MLHLWIKYTNLNCKLDPGVCKVARWGKERGCPTGEQADITANIPCQSWRQKLICQSDLEATDAQPASCYLLSDADVTDNAEMTLQRQLSLAAPTYALVSHSCPGSGAVSSVVCVSRKQEESTVKMRGEHGQRWTTFLASSFSPRATEQASWLLNYLKK